MTERILTTLLMLISFVGLTGAIICAFYSIPIPSWLIAIVAFIALGQGTAARVKLQINSQQ